MRPPVSKTVAVVRREFLASIRTKGYVLGTLFGPALISLFIVLPALFSKMDGPRRLVVVDETGRGVGERIAGSLAPEGGEGRYRVEVATPREGRADSLRTALRRRAASEEITGFVWLSPGVVGEGRGGVLYEGRDASSPRDVREVEAAVAGTVREVRLSESGIDPERLQSVLEPVAFSARGIREEIVGATPDELVEAAIYLAMALYFVILFWGMAVLRGVREEKESRVVELVLSSVDPERLMAGKVAGIGAAGLLQLAVWVGFAALALGFGEEVAAALGGGVPELPRVPWSAGIVFLLCFTGGFFLYASIYAALGAVATSSQDAQSLQYFAVAPLFVAFMMIFSVLGDPGGTLATAGTLVPFTSPLVLPPRFVLVPVPGWQLALTAIALAAACWLFLWIGGKVYKVTILATGQRPSPRQLWRWVRAA
ncbi:MAG: ABC transporter permease [Gemmatimonadota bacterium]|nr:ABC transporter permease [Gemmatimonadota bacterium]